MTNDTFDLVAWLLHCREEMQKLQQRKREQTPSSGAAEAPWICAFCSYTIAEGRCVECGLEPEETQ